MRELGVNGPSRTITELVGAITEDLDEYTESDETTVHVSLHHQHLPKMAEAGVIDYDKGTGEVTLTTVGEQTETIRRRTAELLDNE